MASSNVPARNTHLDVNDFPEPLRRLVGKVNESVEKTRLSASRSQNSPEHFRAPAAEAYAAAKTVQVLLGGATRLMLEQLGDWKEIGVKSLKLIEIFEN